MWIQWNRTSSLHPRKQFIIYYIINILKSSLREPPKLLKNVVMVGQGRQSRGRRVA
jgi:hypothetical protein